MDDAKALIAASGLRIIACDDLEEAAEMVRVFILQNGRKKKHRFAAVLQTFIMWTRGDCTF